MPFSPRMLKHCTPLNFFFRIARLENVLILCPFRWAGPTISSSNVWPDSDYAHIVCAADAANQCPTVMLVPRMQQLPDGTAPAVRICRRDADRLENCAAYAMASNFIYQLPVATGQTLAQTAAAGASSWSVFFTLAQVIRSHPTRAHLGWRDASSLARRLRRPPDTSSLTEAR